MATFSIDFQLYGTAYIDADDEATARAKFEEACGKRREGVEFYVSNDDIDTTVEGVVVSPVFTAYGADEHATLERREDLED